MNRESSKTMPKPVGFTMPDTSWLDLQATVELQMGHHAQAERLAELAQQMREAAQ